jgi:hypothetical protein
LLLQNASCLFFLTAVEQLASLLGRSAGVPSAFYREEDGGLGAGRGVETERYFFESELRYYALVQGPQSHT